MSQTRSTLRLSLIYLLLCGCGSSDPAPVNTDVGADADTTDGGGDTTPDSVADDSSNDGDAAVEPDSAEDTTPDVDAETPDAEGDTADSVVEPCPEAADGDEIAPSVLHTPRWAFTPWISKDISDRADTEAFVAGFQERDIPVGVVVLDSPWETHYNTFVPNPARYGDFTELVSDLREDDIRVVLWITQMVNEFSFDAEAGGDIYEGASPGFELAQRCDFFVNNGTTYPWWKGSGAGIDFFDRDAMAWWHSLQNLVLDAGIAGWKLDFGDEYITTDTVITDAGEIPHQQYSEAYYRDFLEYGQQRRGVDEFVTMVRPYDRSYGFEGRFFARPEHSPVAWVGDNRRDWIGFVDALDHTFRSADAGYIVVGSDVGGYMDRNDENLTEAVAANENTFYSWVAMGALTPFFQLHGRANLTPWTYGEDPEETVRIYRYWSWFHTDLIPFFYSLSEEAIAGRATMIDPIGVTEGEWADDWRFMVGNAFLMAPILNDEWTRDVTLPEGDDWYDWWATDATTIAGGTVIEGWTSTDRLRVPLYVRAGSLVPMAISRDVTGLGSAASEGRQTMVWYPSAVENAPLTTHDEDGATTAWTAESRSRGQFTISANRLAAPTSFVIHTASSPSVITLQETDATLTPAFSLTEFEAGENIWFYDSEAERLYIRVAASETAVTVLGLSLL